MEHFIQIKILHGVATVLLFGGLLGLAFYAWRSWRTGDAARVARGFKRVRLIGWPLLGLSLLAPAGQRLVAGAPGRLAVGPELAAVRRLPLSARLHLLAGPRRPPGAGPAPGRRRRDGGAALGEQALREIKVGLVMALLGAASFIAVAVLMVSKPL